MRVSDVFTPTVLPAIDQAEWEPLAQTKQFTLTPPIHWTASHVAAQFSEFLGKASRTFRADLSGEDKPPTLTKIPTS